MPSEIDWTLQGSERRERSRTATDGCLYEDSGGEEKEESKCRAEYLMVELTKADCCEDFRERLK